MREAQKKFGLVHLSLKPANPCLIAEATGPAPAAVGADALSAAHRQVVLVQRKKRIPLGVAGVLVHQVRDVRGREPVECEGGGRASAGPVASAMRHGFAGLRLR